MLDSHIEVKPGFLEPLLDIVDTNYKAIAAPVFDFWDTFTDKVGVMKLNIFTDFFFRTGT